MMVGLCEIIASVTAVNDSEGMAHVHLGKRRIGSHADRISSDSIPVDALERRWLDRKTLKEFKTDMFRLAYFEDRAASQREMIRQAFLRVHGQNRKDDRAF